MKMKMKMKMKGTIAAHDQLSMQAAFVPPRTALSQRVLSVSSFFQDQPHVDLMESAYQDEAAVRDNSALRQQLTAKNVSTGALQKQVDSLEQEILQLGGTLCVQSLRSKCGVSVTLSIPASCSPAGLRYTISCSCPASKEQGAPEISTRWASCL